MDCTLFIQTNETIITLSIALASMLLTGSLTLFIIIQTNRLNQQQSDLIKRQIKINLLPYRRKLYLNLCSVFSFASQISNYNRYIDYNQKSTIELENIFKQMIKTCVSNNKSISTNLAEAKYLLPKEIAEVVGVIAKDFDTLYFCCSYFTIAQITQSIEEQKVNNQDMLKSIDNISKSILSHVLYINNVIPEIMKIGDLDS